MARNTHLTNPAVLGKTKGLQINVRGLDLLQAARKGCRFCKVVLIGLRHGLNHQQKHQVADIESLDLEAWTRPFDAINICYVPRENGLWYDVEEITVFWYQYWLLQKVTLEVYAEPGDPAAEFVSARPINRMVSSTAAFNQALSWLEECEKDHTYCQASSSKVLPTRIIDTAPAEGADVPRLYASSGASGQYAALSYCWGGPQPLTCRTSNVADLMHAINPHDLARTVQDAIRVTKSLRLRYLWVDSLCIIQDSEEDKAKEIKTMGTIYENAWVTILAQNAAGAEGGFLDERPHLGWEDAWFQLPYPCPSGESGRIWARPRGHLGSETNKNPLNLRAWTLQERVLSPRCLIYGAYQLQWHCRSAKYTCGGTLDGSDKRLRDILDVPHSSVPTNVLPVEDWPGQYWHHWKMTVVNYTLRDLSVPDDKLLAISALAQKYSTLFKCDYVAGLWRSFLDQGLVWASASLCRHSASEKSHHDFTKHCARPSQYRAPSWSWACVDGAKFFLGTAGKHFDAEGGSLTMCGKLRRAFWTEIRQPGDLRGATILMRSLENPIPSGSCFPDALDEIKYNYGSISGPIWCLDMWSDPSPSHNQGVNGLVLRRITPRLFFRIGAFEVKGETGFNWFDGCPRVTLTVI